jgi:hypothetical protein
METQLLNRPDHIISLASAGILVSVEVSAWGATKQDSQISEEVTATKRADKNTGAFTKKLLANSVEHKAAVNERQNIYNWLNNSTYPWSASQRYLPTSQIPKFMKEFKEREQRFLDLVDKLIAALPNAISDQAFVQGTMFNRDDYPSDDEIRRKFSIRLYTAEVPVGDWRNQLANDLADDLTRHFNSQASEMVQNIYEHQVQNLVDVMESISRACTTEIVTENNEVKVIRKRLYDSTFTRLQELASQYREFNLAGSTKLQEAAETLSRVLNNVSVEQLRLNESLKTEVKNTVNELLAKFR